MEYGHRDLGGSRRLLIVLALLMSAFPAFAGTQKIAKDLDGIDPSRTVEVIVRFNQAPNPNLHNVVLRRGGTLNHELRGIRSSLYTLPASDLPSLAADPNVEFIAPNRPVHAAASQGPGNWTNDFHTDSVYASAAWARGLDGSGIGVALIDSGIAPNPDLNKANIVFSQDFVTGHTGSAMDQYGHGTHVAGILAGNGTSSSADGSLYHFLGVASGVNLIDLRVLDANGEGTDSKVIDAIETAIALRDTYNIRVINLSLGRAVFESYTTDPLCLAVEEAWKAGIVVVVAAGNEGRDNSAGNLGYGTIVAPANDPYVITVGAMNTRGMRDRYAVIPASYSSKGPSAIDHVLKPDLVAPGNLVISLYNPSLALNRLSPTNQVARELYSPIASQVSSNTYFVLSGTSMAAPMVSGAAALLLQQDPTLTPDQVKARLMKTAFKDLLSWSYAIDPSTGRVYFLESDIFTVGAGYLDIGAALANTDRMPAIVGSAFSPSATLDANGNILIVVNGSSAMWGSTAMWGTRTLANSTTWGTSAMWGTRTLANSTTSGTSAMWGTRTLGMCTMGGTAFLAGNDQLWSSEPLAGTASPTGNSVNGSALLFGDK